MVAFDWPNMHLLLTGYTEAVKLVLISAIKYYISDDYVPVQLEKNQN